MNPPRVIRLALALALLTSCSSSDVRPRTADAPFVMVLGTAQDGGYPQAGCRRECCQAPRHDASLRRYVVSVAIVDPRTSRRWMLDASPDLPEQIEILDSQVPVERSPGLDGIFLTHGHIGHYTGLMHLGREVMGAQGVPVHVMPRMSAFLSGSGPWSQLVRLGNIRLEEMTAGRPVELGPGLRITPLPVPHRDEFTETVGFRIDGPERSVLYIPDIDKWDRWELSIEDLLQQVDVAYLDGTFFDGNELPGRDMEEIPHPFIRESLDRWAGLPAAIRSRVRFLHLNHTNPAMDPESPAARSIVEAGFRLARQGERVDL